jgi:nicotinamidase-related amidase
MPLTLEAYVEPRRSALILWDMQKGLAGRAPRVDGIRRAALRLIAAADAAGVLVVWSRHVLPPLDLTVGPFLQFMMKKQKVDRPELLKPSMQPGMDETDFIDGMKPAPHHLVLDKSMPSLFVDTPLDVRLKARGIDTIVLTGVATDIGVEFTARHAMAKGYYSVIAEDATAAYTDVAQERSIAFLRQYFPVAKADEIAAVWSGAGR